MKKLLAFLLALVLCVAMACPVLAVEGDAYDSVGSEVVESETGNTTGGAGDDTEGVDSEETPPPPVDPDGPSGPDQPTPGPDDEGDLPSGPSDEELGVPETGDQSPESTALLAGLMGLSFVGIVVVSTILWKNRESSKA